MDQEKQSAFLKRYEPVHDRFEKYCRASTYGGYPFEDLMNDCFLIAYEKMGALKDQQSFLSFLIGISRRLLANASRKNRPMLMEERKTLDPVTMDFSESSAKVQFLHWCLSQLPESQKEVLVLFEIVGFSVREIAQSLDLEGSTVKKRLSRGRKALKVIVEAAYNNENKVKHA